MARIVVADDLALAARPRRHLDHRRLVVGERRPSGRRRDGGRRSPRPAAARRRRGRSRATRQRGAVEHARGARSAPSAVARTPGSWWVEPGRGRRHVAGVPGGGHGPPVGHCFEQVGQRRDDPRQRERRDGGDDGADDEGQPGAGDDRPHPAQRSGRVVRRGDAPRRPGRARRRGVSYGLRGRFGCALAVLRHPASTRATTARPAIQAIRTVRSLIDTQDQTLTPTPPPATGTVRLPGRGHRLWAVPLTVLALLVLLVIAVASIVPASTVATKEVADPADPTSTVDEATPYARTPRRRQPVADRVSFGQLEGVAEIDEDRQGDIYFVTISEPPAVGAVVVGRRWPHVRQAGDVRRPAGDRLPDPGGEVRPPDADRSAAQISLADDAHVDAGRPVRGPAGARLRGRPHHARRRRRQRPRVPGGRARTGAPVRRRPTRSSTRATRCSTADGVPLDDRRRPRRRARRQASRATPSSWRSTGPARASSTVTVELIASPDDPDRTIIGFVPFDTATRRAAVRDRHRHRQHRRAVGRAGVHADADRRAVAGRPHRRPRRRRHRHDRARRHGRRRSAACPEGRRPCARPASTTSSSRRRRARSRSQRARADRRRRRRDHPGRHPRRGAGRARDARRRPAPGSGS